LAAQLTNAPVTPEIAPDVGHGVFRQVPERAFGAVRRFLAADHGHPGSAAASG